VASRAPAEPQIPEAETVLAPTSFGPTKSHKAAVARSLPIAHTLLVALREGRSYSHLATLVSALSSRIHRHSLRGRQRLDGISRPYTALALPQLSSNNHTGP
jgi:hypothetical protein